MSTLVPDRDAVLLSGRNYDEIVDCTNEAEHAICSLLDQLHAVQSGMALDVPIALAELMRLNTAVRMTMQTVTRAGKHEVKP